VQAAPPEHGKSEPKAIENVTFMKRPNEPRRQAGLRAPR
jgi:hypothetical protein